MVYISIWLIGKPGAGEDNQGSGRHMGAGPEVRRHVSRSK